MSKRLKPAVVGFVILFGFSFYGLEQNSHTAARVARASDKSALDNCNAINEGRLSAQASLERTSGVENLQATRLLARLRQTNKLNPPTTPRAKAAAAAGEKFFQDLVDDTKTLTKDAQKSLRDAQPIVNCAEQTQQAKNSRK